MFLIAFWHGLRSDSRLQENNAKPSLPTRSACLLYFLVVERPRFSPVLIQFDTNPTVTNDSSAMGWKGL